MLFREQAKLRVLDLPKSNTHRVVGDSVIPCRCQTGIAWEEGRGLMLKETAQLEPVAEDDEMEATKSNCQPTLG